MTNRRRASLHRIRMIYLPLAAILNKLMSFARCSRARKPGD